MSVRISNCIIANNGRSGIYLQGLRALGNFSVSGGQIYGNKLDGITVDISSDREALGIPASVLDADVIRGAEIAKQFPAAVAFERISKIASWAKLGIDGAAIIESLIKHIQS